VVLLAALVDQSNYLDANTYAHNSQGQFLNSAFVNSGVLPFAFNNLGLNVQWQPTESWYLMFGDVYSPTHAVSLEISDRVFNLSINGPTSDSAGAYERFYACRQRRSNQSRNRIR